MSSTIPSNSPSIAASLFAPNSKTGTYSSATKTVSDPVSEFLAYQKKTPQEKIVDSILKKYGLTKEDLAHLSPEDLKKIQDEIKSTIEKEMKAQLAEKGILVDLSA
ncbi:MAG TPA: hypothetical protein DCM27_03585 [Rhodospirillaceae bacterium]|nr:hypothetical protein [Rhodospirillaceae bacterium]